MTLRRMNHMAPLLQMLPLAAREWTARPSRDRVPEPMVMDDPAGVRAFHNSAPRVQMSAYEFNASMMSRLLPRAGSVLDLGAGSGQLSAHLAAGRPDVTITRDAVVAALREVARIRERYGSAVWLFDFARLRRPETMPAIFDNLYPDADPRLRRGRGRQRAAAWTGIEMREALAEAGLSTLTCSRDRVLGLYQAWWSPGRRPADGPVWNRSPISPAAAFWANRITAGMSHSPCSR